MGQTPVFTDDLFGTKPVKCGRLWNVVMLIVPFSAAVHMALFATVKLFTAVAPAIIKNNKAQIIQNGRLFLFRLDLTVMRIVNFEEYSAQLRFGPQKKNKW